MFAAGGGLGQVHIYDLHRNPRTPVEYLEMPNRTNVYALAFNAPVGDMIAAGEGSGAVRVWKLSRGLVEPRP